MATKTFVIIPFKNMSKMTIRLVDELCEQGFLDKILLFDNGSSEEEFNEVFERAVNDDRIVLKVRPDSTIYQMWNEGWRYCLDSTGDAPVNIAFLNNDITIPPGFLKTLAEFLRNDDKVWITYPDYDRRVEQGVAETLYARVTRGTYQHGGMSGWAFMLKGEAAREGMPFVDEEYEWWYGDDDIARNVVACGHEIRRIVGLPLDHINEATANDGRNDWTHEAKSRDTARFARKWE